MILFVWSQAWHPACKYGLLVCLHSNFNFINVVVVVVLVFVVVVVVVVAVSSDS